MIEPRQIPYVRPYEPVSSVTGSRAMAEKKVKRIGEWRILRGLISRLIVERFGPRVRSQHGKAFAVTLIDRDLERVIRGVEPMEEPDDSRITRERPPVVNCCAVLSQREVRIVDWRILVVLVLE